MLPWSQGSIRRHPGVLSALTKLTVWGLCMVLRCVQGLFPDVESGSMFGASHGGQQYRST